MGQLIRSTLTWKPWRHLALNIILLDTYTGLPGQTEQPEKDWEMLATIADQVLDLPNETIR